MAAWSVVYTSSRRQEIKITHSYRISSVSHPHTTSQEIKLTHHLQHQLPYHHLRREQYNEWLSCSSRILPVALGYTAIAPCSRCTEWRSCFLGFGVNFHFFYVSLPPVVFSRLWYVSLWVSLCVGGVRCVVLWLWTAHRSAVYSGRTVEFVCCREWRQPVPWLSSSVLIESLPWIHLPETSRTDVWSVGLMQRLREGGHVVLRGVTVRVVSAVLLRLRWTLPQS